MKQVVGATFLSLILLMSCSKDDDGIRASRTAKLTMYMTDAPGDYEQVNVDVLSVRVHISSNSLDSTQADSLSDGDGGWVDIPFTPQVFNLIELRDSSALLVDQLVVPEGKISQIRMILGGGNSIKLEGDSVLYDLKVPSSMTSGLKLNFHETLLADSAYSVLIDFDAEKSVVKQGNGNYQLKPVIKVSLID